MNDIHRRTFDRKHRRGLGPKKRFRILNRDGFKCRYCGQSAPDIVLQVDHVEPFCRGGSDDDDNLVAACEACNIGKSDDSIIDHEEDFRQKLHALIWRFFEWPDAERDAAVTIITRAYVCGYGWWDLREIGQIADNVREVSLLHQWLVNRDAEI